MEYSYSLIAEIKAKAHNALNAELDRAVRTKTLDLFMEKYCIVYEDEWMPFEKNRSRILVLGATSGNIREFQAIARDLGIQKEHIEFINDYDKLKRIDVSKFKNSSVYSDIIYGPTPHKMNGMGDTSSLLAEIKKHPSEFPRVIEAIASQKLKITKTSFNNAIKKTRYYEKIILES